MQRRRHGHRRSLRKPRKLAMRERQLMLCLHFAHNIVCRMLYIAKAASQRPLTYTLISHTNTHAVRGGPTLNYVERFRNGLVNELYSLKASQMCKVHTSSHEITNKPYVSSNFENTGKTVTADLTTNYDAGTCARDTISCVH